MADPKPGGFLPRVAQIGGAGHVVSFNEVLAARAAALGATPKLPNPSDGGVGGGAAGFGLGAGLGRAGAGLGRGAGMDVQQNLPPNIAINQPIPQNLAAFELIIGAGQVASQAHLLPPQHQGPPMIGTIPPLGLSAASQPSLSIGGSSFRRAGRSSEVLSGPLPLFGLEVGVAVIGYVPDRVVYADLSPEEKKKVDDLVKGLGDEDAGKRDESQGELEKLIAGRGKDVLDYLEGLLGDIADVERATRLRDTIATMKSFNPRTVMLDCCEKYAYAGEGEERSLNTVEIWKNLFKLDRCIDLLLAAKSGLDDNTDVAGLQNIKKWMPTLKALKPDVLRLEGGFILISWYCEITKLRLLGVRTFEQQERLATLEVAFNTEFRAPPPK